MGSTKPPSNDLIQIVAAPSQLHVTETTPTNISKNVLEQMPSSARPALNFSLPDDEFDDDDGDVCPGKKTYLSNTPPLSTLHSRSEPEPRSESQLIKEIQNQQSNSTSNMDTTIDFNKDIIAITRNSADVHHASQTLSTSGNKHMMDPDITDDFVIPSSIETPEDKQKFIREILRDTSLLDAEKNRRSQIVHSHQFQKHRKIDVEARFEQLNKHAGEKSYSEVIDPETDQVLLGCEHYPRKCKLKAACCNTWVVCRFCHDHPSMAHAMNRFDTTEIRCMECNRVQPVREVCIGCGIRFANYFCAICKFYDDTPGKSIYHCDKCKICRVGKGIGTDNFHCDRCDACVSLKYVSEHQCLKKSLDANCPICGLYIKTSTRSVVFMQCGHTMHAHCFDEYTTEYYICPLCRKSLTDMTAYFREVDKSVALDKLPPELRKRRAIVLCHDCGTRCDTKYHYLYLKCTGCAGYNTSLIRWYNNSTTKSKEPLHEPPRSPAQHRSEQTQRNDIISNEFAGASSSAAVISSENDIMGSGAGSSNEKESFSGRSNPKVNSDINKGQVSHSAIGSLSSSSTVKISQLENQRLASLHRRGCFQEVDPSQLEELANNDDNDVQIDEVVIGEETED